MFVISTFFLNIFVILIGKYLVTKPSGVSKKGLLEAQNYEFLNYE